MKLHIVAILLSLLASTPSSTAIGFGWLGSVGDEISRQTSRILQPGRKKEFEEYNKAVDFIRANADESHPAKKVRPLSLEEFQELRGGSWQSNRRNIFKGTKTLNQIRLRTETSISKLEAMEDIVPKRQTNDGFFINRSEFWGRSKPKRIAAALEKLLKRLEEEMKADEKKFAYVRALKIGREDVEKTYITLHATIKERHECMHYGCGIG